MQCHCRLTFTCHAATMPFLHATHPTFWACIFYSTLLPASLPATAHACRLVGLVAPSGYACMRALFVCRHTTRGYICHFMGLLTSACDWTYRLPLPPYTTYRPGFQHLPRWDIYVLTTMPLDVRACLRAALLPHNPLCSQLPLPHQRTYNATDAQLRPPFPATASTPPSTR